MHLTELTEKQETVALYAKYDFAAAQKDRKMRIGAVKINGWKKCGSVYACVRTGQSFYAEISVESSGFDAMTNDGIESKTSKEHFDLKEFVGGCPVVIFGEQSAFTFFRRNGLFESNKVLDLLAIAKRNYRDKIRDYSLSALANRFCLRFSEDDVVGCAVTIAKLLGEIAVRDDFAHCDY